MLSGQRRWTVNPLSYEFVGSNPAPPIKQLGSLTVEHVSHKYAGKGSSPFPANSKTKNMPQLDTLSFLSQVICLFFFYFVLYFIFLKYFLYAIIANIYIRSFIIKKNYAKVATLLNEKQALVPIIAKELSKLKIK